jgi:hypothetical protein
LDISGKITGLNIGNAVSDYSMILEIWIVIYLSLEPAPNDIPVKSYAALKIQ